MTPELEALIDEFNSKSRLLGWEIETIVPVDADGNKIGNPIPPRK